MRNEGRRPDRTDHSREVDRRRRERRQHGPSPADVEEALQAILDHDVPGTPPLAPLRLLLQHVGFPIEVGDRTLRSAKIASGEPRHGAMRSDDHIAGYEIVVPRDCPECGGNRAVYEYHTHHHIAGRESLECVSCDHVHEQDRWE